MDVREFQIVFKTEQRNCRRHYSSVACQAHTSKKLMHCGLENLILLSKTSLRSMSAELTLEFGADISKDDLITNGSNVTIENEEDMVDLILAFIEKEEKMKV